MKIVFAMSCAALVIGEILAVLYSKRLGSRVFGILREDVPPLKLRGEFTQQWFERNLSAIFASIVGIPTLVLTASAYYEVLPESGWTVNGLLVASILGCGGLAYYGWTQPSAGVYRWKPLGLTLPTFVLVIVNAFGLLLAA